MHLDLGANEIVVQSFDGISGRECSLWSNRGQTLVFEDTSFGTDPDVLANG